MIRAELATWAGALGERQPLDILAFAAERFAPKLGLGRWGQES